MKGGGCRRSWRAHASRRPRLEAHETMSGTRVGLEDDSASPHDAHSPAARNGGTLRSRRKGSRKSRHSTNSLHERVAADQFFTRASPGIGIPATRRDDARRCCERITRVRPSRRPTPRGRRHPEGVLRAVRWAASCKHPAVATASHSPRRPPPPPRRSAMAAAVPTPALAALSLAPPSARAPLVGVSAAAFDAVIAAAGGRAALESKTTGWLKYNFVLSATV